MFAMIRQLGKPTVFLTISASEYRWSDLLCILYRLEHGNEWNGKGDAAMGMNFELCTSLVNEDPVTCCLYFDKMIDMVMFLLKSPCYSHFSTYRVVDYFKRIEFQQRGNLHANILLWLENDPREPVNENMPMTVSLIDTLCSVEPERIELEPNQTHKHTFTSYKRAKDEENKKCRFGAPFWPMESTKILFSCTADDG